LFFTKSIAQVSRNFFVTYSGDAMFKLLKGNATSPVALHAHAEDDHATRRADLNSWPGTAIGIDVNVATHSTFRQLLVDIGKAYDVDVREQKKSVYKKRARFK
jgi:hypothetical protein